SQRSDQWTLIPFLEKMRKAYPTQFKNVIADAGYESEENYIYLKDKGYISYIKPQNYEQMKTGKKSKSIGKPEYMEYDPECDTYKCVAGRLLRPIGKGKRKSASGYVSDLTYYECETCENCTIKDKCTKSTGNKRMKISHVFNRL